MCEPNKFLNTSFPKMRAGQFLPFLMIGAFRNGPLSAGAIFALEGKKNCIKSKKQDGFYYFETKKNSLK